MFDAVFGMRRVVYQQQPGTLAYFESAPHDKACVTRAMDRIMAAMLEGSAAR